MVEDRSGHSRLDESRTKRIDADISALELPCSCLRNRVYTGIDKIDVSDNVRSDARMRTPLCLRYLESLVNIRELG